MQEEQSLWLDFISRDVIKSGKLKELIKTYNIKGITSNPSIFEKAITNSFIYDDEIAFCKSQNLDNKSIYENLAIKDIQDACDILKDGFACLEVSPHLAFDTQRSIKEALYLWERVDRPNVMIKIPGTKEGMPAIRELTKMGLNINVTLLFHVSFYEMAAQSYLDGLSDRKKLGLPIDKIYSVASFFISRIDTAIDKLLEKTNPSLMGKIAIANAKLAYEKFLKLKSPGNPQKLLWASTGTKNPNYSDTLYVDNLIAPNTINTLPLDTIKAYFDHGQKNNDFINSLNEGEKYMKLLKDIGIDFSKICEDLLKNGVEIFTKSFDNLLNAIDTKDLSSLRGAKVTKQSKIS